MGGQSLALLAVKTGALVGPTFTSVQDEIFPLTYTLVWISILLSLFIFRSKIKLDWVRSVVMAITFPFAFVGSFEEIWQNLWVDRGLPPPLANEIWMASWTLLGFSTVLYWRLKKEHCDTFLSSDLLCNLARRWLSPAWELTGVSCSGAEPNYEISYFPYFRHVALRRKQSTDCPTENSDAGKSSAIGGDQKSTYPSSHANQEG